MAPSLGAPERRWYRTVRANWLGLFRRLPERRVLHKRTKSLYHLLDHWRCWLRDQLLTDPRRLLEGTPVPVCDVSRVGRPPRRRATSHRSVPPATTATP